jgi:signal transduction histidine kinase
VTETPTPPPPPARRGWSRLSSRQWTNLILAFTGLIVLAASATGVYVLRASTEVNNRLIDGNSPALAQAQTLQTALLNQETGVRGYQLSGDRAALAPYLDGQAPEAAAVARLRDLVGPGELADVAQLETAADRWRRQFAEPTIVAIDRTGPEAVDPALTVQGKALFDQVRDPMAQLQQHLATARAAARAQVRSTDRWRNIILGGLVLTFLFVVVMLSVWLRRSILRPLDRLGAATRGVAQGEFGRRIEIEGPTDLAGLASDVDSMRRRILAELDNVVASHELLVAQAADLRRSNGELEQFAYVASHDLQEPLRKVTSFCQMLERRYGEVLDERGKQYVDFAVDGAKRMQVLINDLLTFSRVGRLNDLTETVDLEGSLARALANLAMVLEDNSAEVEHDPLPTVDGDPTLLSMLMQNLVGNAVKFRADDRPPRVRVSVEAREGEWLLSVQDNGIGVDPQFADKIFVIFQRLHTRDEYGGTGIGLALCKKIVEYHGGRIWLDPEPGQGARFYFTLPMAAAPEPVGAAADDAAAGAEHTREGVITA